MKEKIPDITAYRLDEAINILQRKGIKFKLKKTFPPSSGFPKYEEKDFSLPKYRVVKQTPINEYTVELIVTAVI